MAISTKVSFASIPFILAGLLLFAAGDSGDLRIIKGDDISVMIEKGLTVNYSGIIVEGDISINKSNLKRTNDRIDEDKVNPIRIKNSRILGQVIFNENLILGDIDFEKTKFEKLASFLDTRFEGKVSFKGAEFVDEAAFGNAIFNESADLSEVKFNGYVTFWSARFNKGPVNFEKAKFNNSSRFWGTQFGEGNVGFGWSRFEGPVSFWGAHFGGNADFKGSNFNDTADFTFSRFDRILDLLGTRFEKELYFTDVKFETLKTSWPSFRDKLVCNGPMYLLLIKNFREMEQFEDADSCYYQYRDIKRKGRDMGWPMVFDYLSWLSCGYGVRWHYTIISGIMIIVIFGIYFESNNLARSTANILLKKGAHDPSISDLWGSTSKSMSFSAMILLSLPSDWFPYGKDEYSELVKSHLCVAILERLIGWGLMLLLIGTLTRLMVRY